MTWAEMRAIIIAATKAAKAVIGPWSIPITIVNMGI